MVAEWWTDLYPGGVGSVLVEPLNEDPYRGRWGVGPARHHKLCPGVGNGAEGVTGVFRGLGFQ